MMSQATGEESVSLLASPYELRTGLGERVADVDLRSAVETGECGFVHSFTTGSTVDGPGVRIVAWLTGCQFKCVYCHNPDTWKMSNGLPVTLNRAIEVVQKYRHGLTMMKGGLTISGGEPLMQKAFVMRVFTAVKQRGIHTALDSNGYLGARLTDADLDTVDLVLLDLKAFTPDLHRRLTGMDNQPVLDFARRLAARKKPVWVRFVLVPGWTDDPSEVKRVAEFAAGLGNVDRVDVLPFHQLGRFKWEKLGMEYSLARAVPPSTHETEEAISQFREAGLRVY